MNRAERRRRTALTVRHRRQFVDGFLGALIHPAELAWSSRLSEEQYNREVSRYEESLRKMVSACKYRHPWNCSQNHFYCGNRRSLDGLTRQEERNNLSFREEIKELGLN